MTAPEEHKGGTGETFVSAWLRKHYHLLERSLRHTWVTWIAAACVLFIGVASFIAVGGEFSMLAVSKKATSGSAPPLPRTSPSKPQPTSPTNSGATIAQSPEVTQTVSQMGRPDDGTDVSTSSTTSKSPSPLNHASQWRPHLTKPEAHQGDERPPLPIPRHGPQLLAKHSGQRRRTYLAAKAKTPSNSSATTSTLSPLSPTKSRRPSPPSPASPTSASSEVGGQPSLIIQIDRAKAAIAYGILSNDVNAAIQAAIGGSAISQVIQGDRRFDLNVRCIPRPAAAIPTPSATSSSPRPTAHSFHSDK